MRDRIGRREAYNWAWVLSLPIVVVCSGGGTSITTEPPPAPAVTTVSITPAAASLLVGATQPLTATVKDQSGSVMVGQSVEWSTSNSQGASVNASGMVTALSAGQATITATSGGKTGTADVTVTAPDPPPPPPPPPPPATVGTVTVSPPSASIVVGATTNLSAVVKDDQGNVMSGQAVTWATSNAAIATVSSTVNSNGVVTGVASGSATITATSSGKSGTSLITVTAPPPPPPPPTGTLLFQENFEDANLASRGWYDNTNVLLNTTEHISGSVSSSEYRFPSGASTPSVGGAQRHKFTPTSSVYISFHVKYSANWVGSQVPYHPHELYVMSTLDGDYDGPASNFLTLYVEHNYQNGGLPVLAIQDNKSINYSYGSLPRNLVGVTENRSTTGCNGIAETNIASECFDGGGGSWYNTKKLTGPIVFKPTQGAGYKNNWNFVEVFFQLNTIVNGIGQKDGVMRYWFNGALVIDRNDIVFRTGARPTLQFSQFLIAPYIGVGSPVTQSMFIDNLRLATGRIP